MFPRVIGEMFGRLAGYTCSGFSYIRETGQRFLNDNETEVYRDAARDAALVLLAPNAARPLVAAYRIWNYFQNRQESQSGQPKVGQAQPQGDPISKISGPGSQLRNGLACYADAVRHGNPILISPFGTLPLERCLLR